MIICYRSVASVRRVGRRAVEATASARRLSSNSGKAGRVSMVMPALTSWSRGPRTLIDLGVLRPSAAQGVLWPTDQFFDAVNLRARGTREAAQNDGSGSPRSGRA